MQKTNNKKKDSLYIIQTNNCGMIKIGRSKNPEIRLKQLQTGNHSKLKLIWVFEGLGHKEKYYHELLKQFKIKGEWFSYDCVGSFPLELYEKIPWGSFDDWWEN